MSGVSGASATTTGSTLLVNGLVSGITTPAVIRALLQGYQAPITDLERQQASLRNDASYYRTISTALQAVQTAAEALNTTSAWNLATATSSSTAVATANAGAGAQTGSLTFTVTQLAQANVLASSGSVASESQVVTTRPSLLVATGAAGLGIAALTAPQATGTPALPIGSFDVTVTQSSASAKVVGTPLAGTVTLPATSTLTLKVDTHTYTLNLGLAAGKYAASTLAAAITKAAAAVSAPVKATVGTTGGLVLSTDRQGATASITVTGGTARAVLGFAATQSAKGVDAVVTVGGTKNTVSSITAGSVLHLTGPNGATVLATVAASPRPDGAYLSVGSAKAANVSTGNGSLSDVVAAINASGLQVAASAVQLASGNDILQVSADATGTTGAVTVGAAAFAGSALGQLNTITAAQDAAVSVGGAGGYTLSSSSDTFTNLLSGTSVIVASTGTATVTVTRDATGEASRVTTLVSAANHALADIQKYAGYTTTKKAGGPLMGNAVVEGIKNQILSIFASASGTSTLGDLKNAGVTLAKTGTLSFTRQAFTAAFDKNPTAVTDLFVQGGTYTPSASATVADVTFAFAGTSTVAGAYKVAVSQSATQATDTGRTLSTGAVSTAETLKITMGSVSAAYTTTAGQSLSSIASGLNAAFAAAKLSLSAQVKTGASGTHLVVTSSAYGSAASFSVTSTILATGSATGTTGLGSATPATFTGTNVAGTINGVTATGSGQVLSLPTGTPAGGLGIVVSASGISAATPPVTLGTFTYRPGAAQQLASAMNLATSPATGSLTTAIKSLTTQATALNRQISMDQQLENEQRATLQKEFVTMETNLGKLQNESSALQGALSKLKTSTIG